MERVILALFVVGSTIWMYSFFGTTIYRALKTGSILGRDGVIERAGEPFQFYRLIAVYGFTLTLMTICSLLSIAALIEQASAL